MSEDSSTPHEDNAPPDRDASELVIEATVASQEDSGKANVAPPRPKKVRRPQPNLLVAFLLSWLPIIVQLVASIALGIGVAVFLIASGRNPQELMEVLKEYEAAALPFGTSITLLVALAVALAFFGRSIRRLLAIRACSLVQLLATIMLAFPLGVLASEVTNLVSMVVPLIEPDFFRVIRESNIEMFTAVAQQSWWFVFISGCLLPGLGEEIFSRGVIGRGLVARWGIIGGVFWTSLLFGIMHVDPIQASGAFTLGIAFHLVFLTTRSLFAPIVLHALNNSLAFSSMRYADAFPIPGMTPAPDEVAEHVPVVLILTALFSAAAWTALLIRTRTRWLTPEGTDWSPGYFTAEEPAHTLGCRVHRQPAPTWLVGLGLISFAVLVTTLILVSRSVTLGV